MYLGTFVCFGVTSQYVINYSIIFEVFTSFQYMAVRISENTVKYYTVTYFFADVIFFIRKLLYKELADYTGFSLLRS